MKLVSPQQGMSLLHARPMCRPLMRLLHNKAAATATRLPLFPPNCLHCNSLAPHNGTARQVFQYMVTVMLALMVMQHAVERYWSLNVSNSAWKDLLFVVFISYPMITLMLVVLTDNEICVRRFMYYRLMSLQVGGNFLMGRSVPQNQLA